MSRHVRAALIAVALLIVMHWMEKHGHIMPKWVWLLLLLPYLLWTALEDDEDDAEEPRGPAVIVLLLGGIVAIITGAVALALRGQGSMLEVLGFMLPAGVVLIMLAIMKAFSGGK
jgi:hypothetical protein